MLPARVGKGILVSKETVYCVGGKVAFRALALRQGGEGLPSKGWDSLVIKETCFFIFPQHFIIGARFIFFFFLVSQNLL